MSKITELAARADFLNYEEEVGRASEADRQEADAAFFAELAVASSDELAKACQERSSWYNFWHLRSMDEELAARAR